MNDCADTTLVTTTSEHDKLTLLEGDNLDNLVLQEVKLDRVSNLDDGVGVTDGTSIVGNDERNTLGSELNLLDLEELVSGLLLRDSVDGEATLDVVKETEVLSRLLDRDDICLFGGKGGGEIRRNGPVSPDLSMPAPRSLALGLRRTSLWKDSGANLGNRRGRSRRFGPCCRS